MTYTRSQRRPAFRPRHRAATRSQGFSAPIVAFLLIASLGILFVGCTPSTPEAGDEFSFTESDIANFKELLKQAGSGTILPTTGSGTVASASGVVVPVVPTEAPPAVDLTRQALFRRIRVPVQTGTGATYIVSNEFLNVRSTPDIRATAVGRLIAGDGLSVIKFIDAAWAQVRLPNGVEGYVSTRYISRIVSESQLPAARKEFEGQYFVNFAFLNVRATSDGQGEKIGELPGQAIIKPLSRDNTWARIMFNGREAFVSMEYLQPFEPHFVVRQDSYTLPILRYDVSGGDDLKVLKGYVSQLRQAGYTFVSLESVADILIDQQQRDVRLPPHQAVLALTGINAQNLKRVSDALGADIPAVFFISSQELGLDKITQKQLQTLLANGYDVGSAGHTGDDLRSLTDAQLTLELNQSRALLSQYAGRDVISVLYPNGGVNARVQTAADVAGYLFGIGASPNVPFARQQLLSMPSAQLTADMTPEQVLTAAGTATK